jgi:superfamily I DNA/RNA helicase
MARHPQIRAFLDQVWPQVDPEGLVFSVLSDAEVLARAADGVLTAEEQRALLWPRPPRTLKAARWSAADAVLVDEAAGLVDRLPSYGHVVVDEAQDLSPMQCRAIARRSEHGSLTLLGDLAQGTAAWSARDWHTTLADLGKPDAPVVQLTLGFRVPGVVLALANRLLPALDVSVPEAVSLRRDGALAIRSVPNPRPAVVAEVIAAMEHEGSIGVIAAEPAVAGLRAELLAAGVEVGAPEADTRVSILPATLAKGLEYDHVVVVEPVEIVEGEQRGLHRLYVVLTRAVSRLTVIHSRPLPGPLAAGLEPVTQPSREDLGRPVEGPPLVVGQVDQQSGE